MVLRYLRQASAFVFFVERECVCACVLCVVCSVVAVVWWCVCVCVLREDRESRTKSERERVCVCCMEWSGAMCELCVCVYM
jgi:hypothetical protein